MQPNPNLLYACVDFIRNIFEGLRRYPNGEKDFLNCRFIQNDELWYITPPKLESKYRQLRVVIVNNSYQRDNINVRGSSLLMEIRYASKRPFS